jgi:hypothetical protein
MQYLVENYQKNLTALKAIHSSIYPHLFALEGNVKFDLIPGTNAADMNLHDISNATYMYTDNIAQSIADRLDELDEYSEYPYLFLFGIANGVIVKSLLNNKKLNRLLLFEPELEILFIALHLWDFSEDIYLKRLIISLTDDFEFNQGLSLLMDEGKLYAKTYQLLYSADYYEKFYSETILKLNVTIIRVFDFLITYAGNSIQDSLQGIEHHIANLKKMITGPAYQKNFVKPPEFERTGTVIMASSGPSLEKQLPQLKEIQDHVTIICGESTLKILELNGITPDICVSMERIIEVTKSFDNVSDEYKKNVIFVRASLQHEKVFDVLQGAQDVLVMRPFTYNYIFELDDYGYLCAGTSVANMAHELAYAMGYKTCIIIGQDLAYGADGKSHAKGHNFGEFQNKIDADEDEITAYGGEGTVRTNFIWRLFLGGLIQTVAVTKHTMLTVNSTEGGARIDGTVENSFQDAIDQYIDKSIIKKKLQLVYPSEQEINDNLQKAKKVVKALVKEGNKLQQKVEKAFLKIAEACKKLENLSAEEQLNTFSDKEIMDLLSIIETIRAEFDANQYLKKFFYEIGQSNIVHFELDLATIKVKKVHNPIENKQKALAWIYNHMPYLFSLAGTIHNICETIKKSDKLN